MTKTKDYEGNFVKENIDRQGQKIFEAYWPQTES